MIAFDTDHLSILQYPESPLYERLVIAMEKSIDSHFVTTVISLEEQTRGWLAAINRAHKVQQQLPYYSRLAKLVDFFSRWQVLPFHEDAADSFTSFRQQGIRIGTMDLKIAAIARTHDALLLTANSQDFEKVPGLKFENWLR